MRIFKCQQNTAEWLQIRCGRITASRIADVIAKPSINKDGTPRKTKYGEMACKTNYRNELVAERLTGRCADHYVSPAMDRGSEMEPYARAAYEVATGADVEQVGFILHPEYDSSGASPDSLVDRDGGLEIKAPDTETHLAWIEAGVVPEEYRPQMQWGMRCGEREWWDFLSFDDRLPEGLRIFCARLERDDKIIAEMEYDVMEFHAEIENKCQRLLPSFTWQPQMPALRSEEYVRIGELDVPADLSDMLGEEIMP